eukprot:Sspe_Gene.26156::Locus_10715_Transcript_1_1_Confidence_1.000_Length_2138::g.26156::m.26156
MLHMPPFHSPADGELCNSKCSDYNDRCSRLTCVATSDRDELYSPPPDLICSDSEHEVLSYSSNSEECLPLTPVDSDDSLSSVIEVDLLDGEDAVPPLLAAALAAGAVHRRVVALHHVVCLASGVACMSVNVASLTKGIVAVASAVAWTAAEERYERHQSLAVVAVAVAAGVRGFAVPWVDLSRTAHRSTAHLAAETTTAFTALDLLWGWTVVAHEVTQCEEQHRLLIDEEASRSKIRAARTVSTLSFIADLSVLRRMRIQSSEFMHRYKVVHRWLRRLEFVERREATVKFITASVDSVVNALMQEEGRERDRVTRVAARQRRQLSLEGAQQDAAATWFTAKERERELIDSAKRKEEAAEERKRCRLRSKSLPKGSSFGRTSDEGLARRARIMEEMRGPHRGTHSQALATVPRPYGLIIDPSLLFTGLPPPGTLTSDTPLIPRPPARRSRIIAPDVSSTKAAILRVLEAAGLQDGDMLYDIGCGAGNLLLSVAEKYPKVRAVGIEIRMNKAKEAFEKTAQFSPMITVLHGDALQADFSRATVLTLYMIPAALGHLVRKFEDELSVGTRVISLVFALPGWKHKEFKDNVFSYVFGEHISAEPSSTTIEPRAEPRRSRLSLPTLPRRQQMAAGGALSAARARRFSATV